MCSDEMEARYLPAAVYECEKGTKEKKKHDDKKHHDKKHHDKKHHDKKNNVRGCGVRIHIHCPYTPTPLRTHQKQPLTTMLDAVKHLFGLDANKGLPFTCGTAFTEADCEKGCYWYGCCVLHVVAPVHPRSQHRGTPLNTHAPSQHRCTMPYGPMGQCVGKDQKSLLPGAECVKAKKHAVEA